MLAFVLAFAGILPVFGANPPPTQLFYVPFPEDQQLAAFDTINAVANDPITVFITLAAATDGTVIYYDHWEDGYEKDITNPVQSTTQIFGDGNPANGYPPGNAADLISAGTVFNLRNFVATSTLQSVLDYDARDKIASFKPISVTKMAFPDGTDTLLAGCVEVFEHGLWGNEYRSPVGVDMPTSAAAGSLTYDENVFNYAALAISSGPGGASVQIDKDNNGVYEETVVLAEGETVFRTDVNVGGHVLADKPIQVILFTGTLGSTYASRDTSLLPTYRWSSDYYAPVSTRVSPADGTVTFLYNPGATAITVSYDYRSSATAYTTASISVPAGGNTRVLMAPSDGSTNFGAYRFYTTGANPPLFYAISAIDADAASGSNQNWDGGFTLVGKPSLTTQVLVSLGIGRDPYSSTNPTENGNPVWITTAGNGHTQEKVYVDYNGDNAGPLTDPNGNKYDIAYNLRELEQLKIYDPDGDQSGMLVYTLNPTVKIAAVWGQDPSVASVAQPGLDVASLVPPLREGNAGKKSNLSVDTDGDGFVSAGDTLEYDIRAVSDARTNIPGPFGILDNLPADITYVPGTTRYRFTVGGAWQAWVSVPDNGSGTPFPLDGAGLAVPGNLPSGQQLQVVFKGVVDVYADLSAPTITNTGTVEISPYGLVIPVTWTDTLYGSIGDRVWNDLNGDGVQDVGEAGINGVKVYADLNNNGTYDTGEPTSTTNSGGNYLLKGLTAGTYTVRVNSADIAAANVGYGPTYDLDGIATSYVATVVLAGAQDRVDVDFGYRVGASVGDRVWMDRDGDGVQEAGEPGINGVRVFIDSNSNGIYDSGEPNTLTSGDGGYYIGNLAAGTLAVRVDASTLPAGATQTFDLDGVGTANKANVTLIGAEHRADLDFGYRGTLSIGDLVWEDLDANGSNVTTTSTTYNVYNGRVDLNNDGAGDNNDDGFIGTMRIINGYADIDNDNSTPVDNDDDGTFLGITIVNGGFDINNSASITTADDGTATYTVNGTELGIANIRVYIDSNGNGTFESTEPSALTNASGIYSIGNLFNGTYIVKVDISTLPSSYAQTYDLVSPTNDHKTTVTLSGASRTDVDFGYRNDASIGDLVWNDRNANGVRDAGESGIEGVLVYIDADNDNLFDQGVERFAITDNNGYYLIPNLAAGTYNVRVEFSTLPQGTTQTYDLTSGTLDHEAARTLTVSENAVDVDFGYRASASVGDFVWNDIDADGVQDSGELGISGVRVYLDINGNGTFDSASEPAAVTDSAGAYLIGNLVPGTYTARVDTTTLPAGRVQTFDANGALDHAASFSLAAAQARADIDFGYVAPVSIGDFVWNDVNANGQQDSGETGISGVTVTVYNAANDTIAGTATTNASGAYSFANLMPGTYYVVFDKPSGYNATPADRGADATDSDANTSTGRTPNVTLTGGQSNLTLDAGFYLPVSIGDFVWNDTNASGQQDSGETGLNGVTVTLYRPGFGPDGIAGNADDATAVTTTTSNASGAYSFTSLPPGTYQVGFGTSSGYNRTLADQGADATDSDANAGTGLTATFVLTAGQSNNTIDAGYYQPVAIGDFVWNDVNANGQQDSGETGLSGVTVSLYRPGFGADGIAGNADDAAVITTATTVSGGAYSFTNLRPGTYQVGFSTLSGYNRTLADQGADATDSDANASTGLTTTFALTAGQTNNTIDAGYYQPVSIGDFVWNDVNANGQQDSGETGLSGVTVTLYRPGFGPDGIAGNADDALVITTATTISGGAYNFTSLPPGSYQVGFGTLSGYGRTLADQGADATDSDANASTGLTATFALTAGQTNNTIDAGYYQSASIGDFVWNDVNANGQQDSGETGLSGVTVSLYRPGFGADGIAGNADDALVITTATTVSGGAYSFTGLRPGTYQVGFGTLSGYNRTLADQGVDATDSDANASTGLTSTYVLTAGQTNNTIDAGYYQPVAIGDFVWNDVNANGQQDSGETGLSGVTVSLYRPGFGPDGIAGNADDAALITTATTVSGGAYNFTGLPSGTYQVGFGALSGYSRTLADQGADATDSDANAGTGLTAAFALTAGQTNNTIDAGYYQPAAIGDFVWNDVNANGQQDSGETGLSGVTVSLYRPGFGADGIAGNADDAALITTATTVSGGAYGFSGLRPGTYQVGFGALSGYNRTFADLGADATDSDANAGTGLTTTFALTPGQTNNTIDAGYYQPVSIGDFVWNDVNANGQQDSGETGLSGVTVSLYRPGFGADGIAGNADDALVITTATTVSGGAYSFTGLPPGTYQVGFGTLSGYNRTLADQGVDATDSDANSGTGLTATFALTAGQTNNTIDAGYYQPVAIGDFVWNDVNANGQQDSGETGLNGVTVSLYRPGFGPDGISGNADDATAVGSTTSNGSGAYSFSGLPPGTYQVGFGTLSGFGRTLADQGADATDSDANAVTGLTNTFVLTAGQTNNTIDAGYYQSVSIGDFVWNDVNANGQQDSGETGLNGVTVSLYRPGFGADGIAGNADDAAAVTTATTNGSGAYGFTGLRPGSYQVGFGSVSGYNRTLADLGADATDSDASASTGLTTTYALTAGQTNNTIDAGYYQPGAITGTVFADTDNNNTGDVAISGVVLTLKDSSGNDIDSDPLTGGMQPTTTTTNASGVYTFGNLLPGSYRVVETQPSGYLSVSDVDGLNNNVIGDQTPVVVTAGQTVTGRNFVEEQPGTVFGHLYLDTNGNGTQDSGEPNLANVDVLVTDSAGGTQTVSTNSSGNWTASVPPGSTTADVQESDPQYPAGYTQTEGNDPTTVTAAAGTSTNGGIDGYFLPGSITGSVLADTNNDDTGDSPIGGVTLTLVDGGGNPVDGDPNTSGVQPVTTITAGNGSYSFANLPPGTYGVAETQPAGYNSVSDKDGGNLNEIRPITVTAGVTNSGNDFIEEQPGSISGTVLADTDGDGDGDVPLQSVVIHLLNSAGSPVLDGLGAPVITTTAANGSYSFGNLPPGSYRVREDQPANYNSVSDTDGANNNGIGDEHPILVTAGNNNGGNNFIEIQLGVISGYVLLDTDNNGSGDAPLPGVVLNLLDGSGSPVLDGLGAPIQVATGAGGFYSFTLVPVGTYRVSQNQPVGYGSVSDVDGANNNVIGDQTPIIMTPGLVVTNRNFVEIELGSIAGTVFDDSDNNGTGDTPLANVALTLLDGSGNPVDGNPNIAGVQLVIVVTDSGGHYLFGNLFPGGYQVSESQPSGYGSVSDVDGGNLDRIGNIVPISVAPGQNVTGRDFVEVRLGSISGNVYVGSAPLAGITLTLLDDNGNPVDGDPNTPGVQLITTTTDSNGHYTFTGVIPGSYRVAQTQPQGYDSFGDLDGGDINIIGDVTRIVVLPGQSNDNNNFIETLDTCPDDWAQWKYQHPGETADGNPDADTHDNLAEFAFAQPALSGAGDAWFIRPSTLAPGTIEGVFTRPKGAYLNVTYSLEYVGNLQSPMIWASIEIDPSMTTVVDNGDCTETVTIHDLETVTGMEDGEGFVRIRADLDEENDETTDHTSYTEVEGWKETVLGICCRTYSNPFLRSTVFTGSIEGVTGQTLDLTGSAGAVDLSTLIAAGSYYVEVTSGENEGQRFDVLSATATSLTLANDGNLFENAAPYNTRLGALPADLVNNEIVLRRHWTLGEVFPPSGFGATDDRTTADQVQLFANGQWIIYWLYDDGVSAPRWVKTGDNTYADQGNAVLAPGQGLFFNNRTVETSILAYGEVRENNFIRPLATGSNLISGGYPLDQSAASANGRAMTVANGFFGSRDIATADSFFVWKGDGIPGDNGYITYFLNNNAPRLPSVIKWAKVGDASLFSRDSEILLLGNRSVFLRSKNGLSTYTVPSPWAP